MWKGSGSHLRSRLCAHAAGDSPGHGGVHRSLARAAGVRVILDPAPGRKLPPELLTNVDVLTPNETEAGIVRRD